MAENRVMSRLAVLGGKPLRTREFEARRTMGEAEKRAVLEVLESDNLSAFFGSPGPQFLGGPRVRKFERKWAEKYGFAHAVSMNSCTTGLMTCVAAVGIEPGDEVIVPPYTMSASATAALFYGGIPVFADVDPDTFNISPAAIERAITPRTKAIIVVHLFGQAADMDPILAIARKHRLKVIEDAAQAPGVAYKGRPVGAIGDVGAFSLNYHKHIHTGEGGMIVTRDEAIALRCQLIRNHGENVVEGLGVENLSNLMGANYRLTELQAAIGEMQLDRLDGYLEHRRRLASRLQRRLSELRGVTPAKTAEGCGHAFYVYPIKYDETVTGVSRKRFVEAVNSELPKPQGWEQTGLVEGYVRPLYQAPMYRRKTAMGSRGFPWSLHPEVRYEYPDGLCPVVEDLYKRKLLLTPLVREPLSEKDMDDFAGAIEKVLDNAAELRDLP